MSEIDNYCSIKDFALSKGVTTQAIYRQIKRDSLKEEKFRKLTIKKIGLTTIVKVK
jgi:hypothetical protein